MSARHHRGRKVTSRICTPPKKRRLGVSAIAEDERGTAVPLSLFNMPISSTIHTPETMLPNGTICIVKEPFLKAKKKEAGFPTPGSSLKSDPVRSFLNKATMTCPEIWRLLFPRLKHLHFAASRGTLPLGPMAFVDVLVGTLRAMSFDVDYSRNDFAIRRWGMKLHAEYEFLNPRVCLAIREYARVAFRVLVGEDETFNKCFPRFKHPA
ncbi:hypothetical protein ISF_07154 [Cordyceps fumosorosea ARSEF 2679]|uniref:Uncharacterized protein n=1 Tax=Cordyceps fumosorosea (strain ARSEF 2679) TaxID=1081104 RepID=A0A167Q2W9_CORFA|nr:hypothetical protein ISF_07154 [Cordyceps fumosorosea ARSEF 2679]OAA57233.1 hypothetical protein ISF_07154 [Cordyceps fumosorosea ARSEF 2679]